jgi:hypothetical protein
MLKWIGIFVGGLAITLFIIVGVFLYSNDSVNAVLTAPPQNGVNSSDYLSSSEENGHTVLNYPLQTTYGLKSNGLIISEGKAQGGEGVFIKKQADGDSTFSNAENTLALLEGSDFNNGIIEVELKAIVAPNTSRLNKMISRGFVGIGFRVSEDVESFECFYLRPENGITKDEERYNHAVQYISVPEWDFERLREEYPEKYESAAAIAPDTWHKIRIEVKGKIAKLFIDAEKEPTLVVDDLRLGAENRGKIGLWVGVGTNAFFKNLKITQFN